jgi:hypothetical protein
MALEQRSLLNTSSFPRDLVRACPELLEKGVICVALKRPEFPETLGKGSCLDN